MATFKENKTEFCNALCNLLRMTSCAGDPKSNPLVELRYIKMPNGDEFVRPIFEDGCGENGYYDVNVTCDANMEILLDVVREFVRPMW